MNILGKEIYCKIKGHEWKYGEPRPTLEWQLTSDANKLHAHPSKGMYYAKRTCKRCEYIEIKPRGEGDFWF